MLVVEESKAVVGHCGHYICVSGFSNDNSTLQKIATNYRRLCYMYLQFNCPNNIQNEQSLICDPVSAYTVYQYGCTNVIC